MKLFWLPTGGMSESLTTTTDLMALLKLCFTLFPVGLSHFISSKFYYTQAHIYSLSFYFSIPSCPPSHFTYPRLFGMTGVIRTNSSDQHTLSLHPHVSWPDFINPLVLLLLYYTLVALLHKWVHITEEVCVCVCIHVCVRGIMFRGRS